MKNFISGPIFKGLLMSLIPVIIFTSGILIVSNSDGPQVKYIAERVRPGYETAPATYVVEASYAKYWHDSRKIILIVLAFVIVIIGTVAVVYNMAEKEISSKAGNFGMAGVWLVSTLLIFLPMVFKYGSSSYESTLTVQQYEDNRGNLDKLFPTIERESK